MKTAISLTPFTWSTKKRTFIAERPLKLKPARKADLETVNDGELDNVLSHVNAAMTDEALAEIILPGEAGVTKIDVLILCAKPPVRIVEHVLQAAANKPAGLGVASATLKAEIITGFCEPPTNLGVGPCNTTGGVRQPVAESVADLATKG